MIAPSLQLDDAAAPLRILRVATAAGRREFIECVYRLRGREPLWVPPLRRDVTALLDPRRHPFHQHSTIELFLARRGDRTVGRIAAIENTQHNRHWNERLAFFGFLDAEDDPEVFRALMVAAERWARARGATALRGPVSPSTNDECGLLVEGFDTAPALMTPWHPPHYRAHIEALGFGKGDDLLCYWLTRHSFSERIPRLADAVEKRLERASIKVRVRELNPRQWQRDLDSIRYLYNSAWSANWGFVPMTDAEFAWVAKELRPIVNPRYVLFAEVEEKPVAFALALPDYNVVLRHLAGRLGPAELLLAMWLKGSVKSIRLFMMGVLPEHRHRGIDLMLYRDIARHCVEDGIYEGEMSWILERNRNMNRALEAMGARVYRRLRMYEKVLA